VERYTTGKGGKGAGVGNSQLGCTKIRDSREILEIPKDSMRGEIGRFWSGRTRVYEDSGELPTPEKEILF
jgi:hypothetical protein